MIRTRIEFGHGTVGVNCGLRSKENEVVSAYISLSELDSSQIIGSDVLDEKSEKNRVYLHFPDAKSFEVFAKAVEQTRENLKYIGLHRQKFVDDKEFDKFLEENE